MAQERNPLLARLNSLVGEWDMQAFRDGEQLSGRVMTNYRWMEGGSFLIGHADDEGGAEDAPREWIEHSPFPVSMVIGLDDTAELFAVLYADARNVFRVYQMTLADAVWKQWRDAPGFYQRFTGTFARDGRTIEARWEMSQDGTSWGTDFDLIYRKVD